MIFQCRKANVANQFARSIGIATARQLPAGGRTLVRSMRVDDCANRPGLSGVTPIGRPIGNGHADSRFARPWGEAGGNCICPRVGQLTTPSFNVKVRALVKQLLLWSDQQHPIEDADASPVAQLPYCRIEAIRFAIRIAIWSSGHGWRDIRNSVTDRGPQGSMNWRPYSARAIVLARARTPRMLRFDSRSPCCSAIRAVGLSSPTAIGCSSCCCIDGFHPSASPLICPAPELLVLAPRGFPPLVGVGNRGGGEVLRFSWSSASGDERRERALGCRAFRANCSSSASPWLSRRGQIYGQTRQSFRSALGHVPAQSCAPDRGDGFVCGPDHRIYPARDGDCPAGAAGACRGQCHKISDGGVDRGVGQVTCNVFYG